MCPDWSDLSMVRQITVILCLIFVVVLLIQYLYTETASRTFRNQLKEQILTNYDELRETIQNPLKSDALITSVGSKIQARE